MDKRSDKHHPRVISQYPNYQQSPRLQENAVAPK